MAEQASMLDVARDKNFKTKKKKSSYGGGGGGNDNPQTKMGYDKSEVISALQKAIRRNKEPEALYWASELMDSGESYRMWRRLVVIAAEDVGLADPDMTHKIMIMKQAHDFARESNVVFQAVMMLCRAPKNREADDAAYMYDLRRKDGWRITMPPEAVDGHTRRGRTALYRMADKSNEPWNVLWDKQFYFDCGLLENYVEIESDGTMERYKKALLDYLGLPYDTYDIHTSKQPRLLSGGEARKVSDEAVRKRIPEHITLVAAGNEDGEPLPNTYDVKSFTTEGTWYRVNIDDVTCTCPAYEQDPNSACKHIMAVIKEVK